jgi:hypothetical protein
MNFWNGVTRDFKRWGVEVEPHAQLDGSKGEGCRPVLFRSVDGVI